MIYDIPILLLQLPENAGAPINTTLVPVSSAYCGELTVYHTRYWESVQAGSRVERLVQLPLHRDVDAGMFVKFRGHIYAIEQTQFDKDGDQLPCTVLSLKRPEELYDIAGI